MSQQFTFTYHVVEGIEIKFDITFPRPANYSEGLDEDNGKWKGSSTSLKSLWNRGWRSPSSRRKIIDSTSTQPSLELLPAAVFFHGGGLTAGNRKFVSHRLKAACLAQDIAFISADYRLLFPCTGHEILDDVKALFAFLANNLNTLLSSTSPPCTQRISRSHLAVAGASAGAYPARLAATFADPRPKALFVLYGSGGNLLSPFYLSSPPPNPYMGQCSMFVSPTPEEKLLVKPLADCSMSLSLEESREIPGYRTRVFELYSRLLHSGIYLDALTGIPGISETLRTAEDKEAAIPKDTRVLFPQLFIDAEFPATFLVHGTSDKAVDVAESWYMAKQLAEKGVTHEFVVAERFGHQFDESLGVDVWERYLGGVVPFLLAHIEIDEEDGRRGSNW